MKGKHTPGPWKIYKHTDRTRGRKYQVYGGEPDVRPQGTDYENVAVAERYSDALLIHAAPDLLEACEAYLKFENECCEEKCFYGELCHECSVGNVKAQAKAAIAKARGEE